MSIRIKTKLLCKQNFTGRCQTSGCWQQSLHRREAQCSLFIFVRWQSAWLSNKGKSICPWEIIIKQRTTHGGQCVECVSAGGEQVYSNDLTSQWCKHNRRNKGFHRVRRWRTVLWLGFMLCSRWFSGDICFHPPPVYVCIVFPFSLPVYLHRFEPNLKA